MNPAEVNFAARNNAPWQDAVPLTLAGVAINLNLFTPLQLQVKAEEFTPRAEIDAAIGTGLSIEPDGALGINISETIMSTLFGTYYYDLRGTVSGEKVVMMVGTLTVEQGITYP